ncbi:MAG TPA: guanitoxin biosynthesis heme-dependent pre-guanitoxin N-hydroxylase GntA [Parachlamydiaceae bacterium]|nr:guanitoxin biosynthesis heme-dependent pre-guanitoxin N-hydroxylase GntA [Parachlamydiaceae bacterium]
MLLPEHYMKSSDGRLIHALDASIKIPDFASFIHTQFKASVMSPQFPCSGAKTAFSQETYRYGVFKTLGSKEAAIGLLKAISCFIEERKTIGGEFHTFIASFTEATPANQPHFTELLWKQLQHIHDQDTQEWDVRVSSDPSSPEFSFSIAGSAFFVIGMHATSPRWARRFMWPTLVFNPHDQFEKLREKGDFEKFKQIVRKRDFNLQGSINPVLEDFGKALEANQYSGELLGHDWKCPFSAKSKLN